MEPEDILLTPYEKWRHHKIVPYQFLVHMFMLIIVTFFAVTANTQHAAFARRMNLNWYKYFIGEVDMSIDDTPDPAGGPNLVYDVSDLLASLSSIVTNYYNIKNTSLTKINYHAGFEPDIGYQIEPMKMNTYTYRTGQKIYDPVYVPDFAITQETLLIDEQADFGPYNVDVYGYNAVKDRIHLTQKIELSFTLTSFDLAAGYRTCSSMDILINFNNFANGPFVMSFENKAKAGCEGDAKYPDSRTDHVLYFWVPNLAMFVFAIVWVCLIIRGSIQDIRWYVFIMRKKKKRIFKRLRLDIPDSPSAGDENGVPTPTPKNPISAYEHWFPTEQEIEQAASVIKQIEPEKNEREKWITRFPSMKPKNPEKLNKVKYEKPKMLRVLWKVYRPVLSHRFAFLNTLCALCCALLSIVNFSVGAAGQFVVGPSHKFLLGICVALVWGSSLTWAADNHGYFIIVKTLRRGIPRVAAFSAGVFPIFMAYTLFGMIYFGDHSGRFGTVVDSMVSLFAIMNGDIIRESYLDLMSADYFVGQIYLYSFICFFIYVVLAVFVVMVEKSYEFMTLEPEEQQQETIAAFSSPRSMSIGGDEKAPDFLTVPTTAASNSSSLTSYGSLATPAGHMSAQQANLILEMALTASHRSLSKELLAKADDKWGSLSEENVAHLLKQILELQDQAFKGLATTTSSLLKEK